tara:strand:- start:1200 stop:1607 length:408 start_codon:yes stop_codon:yes gene_type:complete
MSEIKTDKLTGTSTAGSISVTGEGNSTTTNLQQGLCKAWITYTSTSYAIGDSLNCTTATDHGFGDFTTNFVNNFGSENITCGGTSTYNTNISYRGANSHTSSSVGCALIASNGSQPDADFSYGDSIGLNYHGDLA